MRPRESEVVLLVLKKRAEAGGDQGAGVGVVYLRS